MVDIEPDMITASNGVGMKADVRIGGAWDGDNEVTVGVVLEMILDNGIRMSRADGATHYVMMRRTIGEHTIGDRRVMSGGYWPTSVAIRPMVKRMKIEQKSVGIVRYQMKVSDTGSVYHWMELT